VSSETKKLISSAILLVCGGLLLYWAAGVIRAELGSQPAWYRAWIPGMLEGVGGILILSAISIVFVELALRKELLKKMAEASRRFFTTDEQLGEAIYQDLITPYIGKDVYYRSQLQAQVTIEELAEDRPINSGSEKMIFRKADYSEITVELSFQARMEPQRLEAVFLLSELFEDLGSPFKNPNVLYRDELILAKAERDFLLSKQDSSTTEALLRQIIFWDASAGGEASKPSYSVIKAGKAGGQSVGLCISNSFAIAPAAGPVSHQIKVKMPYHKSANSYPFVLSYPYKNPVISFRRAGVSSEKTLAFPFLTTALPFDTNVRRVDESVRVSLKSEAWTFPSSGVVFVWK
jgi:hypothetical protein